MKLFYLIFSVGLLLSSAVNSQSVQSIKSVTAEDFKIVINSKLITIIDVRTNEEYAESHIPESINIDVNNPRFYTLVKAASKTPNLALYCRSGRRSKLAASKLHQLKVQIYDLNNGFLDWKAAGFAVSSTKTK